MASRRRISDMAAAKMAKEVECRFDAHLHDLLTEFTSLFVQPDQTLRLKSAIVLRDKLIEDIATYSEGRSTVGAPTRTMKKLLTETTNLIQTPAEATPAVTTSVAHVAGAGIATGSG